MLKIQKLIGNYLTKEGRSSFSVLNNGHDAKSEVKISLSRILCLKNLQ